MSEETRHAAIAIPIRPADRALQVWCGRRSATARLHPGFHVFPGGSVEPQDHQVAVAGCSGSEATHRVTAARELFEEAGIWVARGPRPADPDRARSALRLRQVSFADLLAELGAGLHAPDLQPVGTLLTPFYASYRYRVHYFLAPTTASAAAAAEADRIELSGGGWTDPGGSVAAWREAELLMVPAIRRIMETLARSDGVAGRARRQVAGALREPAGHDPALDELLPGLRLVPLRTPTLPPATHTNCVILGEQRLAVIDPASPWDDEQNRLADCLETLRAQGREIDSILITHHHEDHVGGVERLARELRIPVRAHPETRARIAAPVSDPLREGDRLALEPGRAIDVVWTPGHAPGHLVFFDRRSRALVAGDMIAGVGTVVIDPLDGDMADYLRSLTRIGALRPRLLIPAHGAAIGAPRSKIAATLAHRRMRERKILRALAAAPTPATPAQLLPLAYDDTPPELHGWAERSLRSHLRKLVAQGRVARRGERHSLSA